MARLFPESGAGTSVPPEEARIAALARDALRPDRDHWTWVHPTIPGRRRGRHPSLVLLGPGYGLAVLEVAGFGADAVIEGTRNWVTVRGGSGELARVFHPERVARDTARLLEERVRGSAGEGNPETVGWGVAYPRLTRRDLDALAARGVPLSSAKALTAEDLTPRRFAAALARLGGTRPGPAPTDADRERIRGAIEPQLHFLDLREEEASPAPDITPFPGFWLDRKQERMARELASPRTLVYGPAGSGKTVFLVARAQYWLDRRPDARVLFTCYNASLASHLRRVLVSRDAPPDGDRLTVRHYHDLCGGLLGIENIHERPPAFYAELEPKLLAAMARRDDLPAYDLILVDEGQDFTLRMIEVLVRLGAPGGEITVVCDPAQDIYGRWSAGNLAPMREHATESLVDCYRNTAPIFALALAVLTPETRREMGLTRLEMTRPGDLGRDGPPPEVREIPGLDALVESVARAVSGAAAAGRPVSDVAVLYPDRHAIPGFAAHLARSRWKAAGDPRYAGVPDDEDDDPPSGDVIQGTLHPASDRDDQAPSERPHFARALEHELEARGIPAEWVARDFAAKASYDIAKPRLTLSTIHSAKGMDFHTVILLGAESLSVKPGRDGERARALLFTGITRARERLILPYFEPAGWVPGLRRALEEEESRS